MAEESSFFGVSWRGVLALIVILTVCAMSLMGIKIEEPLYTLVLVVSSAYFGSKVTNGAKKDEPSGKI